MPRKLVRIRKDLVSFSSSHYLFQISKTPSIILLKNDFSSIPVAVELGRLVFNNFGEKYAGRNVYRVHRLCKSFLGHAARAQFLPPSLFSITKDVVMSISLMYEQPESGKSFDQFFDSKFNIAIKSFFSIKILWLTSHTTGKTKAALEKGPVKHLPWVDSCRLPLWGPGYDA